MSRLSRLEAEKKSLTQQLVVATVAGKRLRIIFLSHKIANLNKEIAKLK